PFAHPVRGRSKVSHDGRPPPSSSPADLRAAGTFRPNIGSEAGNASSTSQPFRICLPRQGAGSPSRSIYDDCPSSPRPSLHGMEEREKMHAKQLRYFLSGLALRTHLGQAGKPINRNIFSEAGGFDHFQTASQDLALKLPLGELRPVSPPEEAA